MPTEETPRMLPNYFILITVIYMAAVAWALMMLPNFIEFVYIFIPLFVPLPFFAVYMYYYVRYYKKPTFFDEITFVKIIKWIFLGTAVAAIAWGFLLSAPI